MKRRSLGKAIQDFKKSTSLTKKNQKEISKHMPGRTIRLFSTDFTFNKKIIW